MLGGLVSMDQLVCAVAAGVLYMVMGMVMNDEKMDSQLLLNGCIFAAAFLVVQVLMAKVGLCGMQEPSGNWFTNLFK